MYTFVDLYNSLQYLNSLLCDLMWTKIIDPSVWWHLNSSPYHNAGAVFKGI